MASSSSSTPQTAIYALGMQQLPVRICNQANGVTHLKPSINFMWPRAVVVDMANVKTGQPSKYGGLRYNIEVFRGDADFKEIEAYVYQFTQKPVSVFGDNPTVRLWANHPISIMVDDHPVGTEAEWAQMLQARGSTVFLGVPIVTLEGWKEAPLFDVKTVHLSQKYWTPPAVPQPDYTQLGLQQAAVAWTNPRQQ